MDQRVQYATTADGLAIAYAVTGEGLVLVSVPAPPDNHLQLEWDDPERRRDIEALSRHRTLVRFDPRGAGMSDRETSGFSLEERLRDMEAVVARVGCDRFALASGSHGVQLAVAYAARHPEQVTHLVAVNPFVHGHEFMDPAQLQMWSTMLATDYRLFTDALGAQIFGWGNDRAAAFGANFRGCVEDRMALAMYEAMIEEDLGPLLPQVRCPVLVIRMRETGWASEAACRKFAAALPDAQMVLVEGQTVEGASLDLRVPIGRFFGEDWSEPAVTATPAPPRPAAEPQVRAILFTDLVGHTAMMSRLGDARGRELLREHERLTREALAAHAGSEVKTLGDGFMASFGSAQKAIECAIMIQRAFTAPLLAGELGVRCGINAGEPIAEDDDLFGASVIAAARVAALARGGQVLVADVVRQLAAGKGFLFSDTGEHILKGLEEPVRVWELRWAE